MFRPAAVYENATVVISAGGKEILRQRKRIFTPGEMAELTLKPDAIRQIEGDTVSVDILV